MYCSGLFILSLMLAGASVTSALQFCQLVPEYKTNLCLAVTSGTNVTTGKNDLSMHMSVGFADRMGWAAVGIGEEMSGALMFVIFPGAEVSDVTVSIRTIDSWRPPIETSETPEIVTIGTWVEPVSGLHHAQFICYNCESWASQLSSLNLTSNSQPWIWASNYDQKTQSARSNIPLVMHHAAGVQYLNMASVFDGREEGEIILAQLAQDRVSQPVEDVSMFPLDAPETDSHEPVPEPIHHPHKLLGIVSLHGIVLALSFLIISAGTLAIRSGLPKSFKLHWAIQAAGGSGIVLGCMMGIWLSYKHGNKWNSIHQLIGLLILPTIILQAIFGYWHHVNFVRFHRRTAVSGYHVWTGRFILVWGNINILLGVQLAQPSLIERALYYLVVLAQAMCLGVMWYFWGKEGKTIIDVLKGRTEVGQGVEYVSIEQGGEGDAFIVGGVEDEYELDEEEGHSLRKGEDEKRTE